MVVPSSWSLRFFVLQCPWGAARLAGVVWRYLERIRPGGRILLLPAVVLNSSKGAKDLLESGSPGCNSYGRKPVDFAQFAEVTRQPGLYWLLLNEVSPLR